MTTSGARYAGDPVSRPVWVNEASDSIRAMPKSVSFTCQLAVDEDVGRLHVAVQDAGSVGGHERVRHLQEQGSGDVGGERAPVADDLGQRAAVDVLHHQPVGVGLAVDDGIEDGHHVRVVELGTEACLALGPRQVGAVGSGQQPDLLEGHLAPEDLVATEPDCAHAPSPDLTVE